MNKTKKTYIFLITFCCSIHIVTSQIRYVSDSSYFQKVNSFYFISDSTENTYQFIDTSIVHFQNSLPFYFNGQIGAPQPNYLLLYQDVEIGSRILGVYYPDILDRKHLNVYRTKGFYSQLEGIAGSKNEQHFRAFFTSPIKQKHHINFYLRRTTNTGFYQNQKASVTNLFIDYHLFGRKKISMDASILLNYIKHQENGGITKDTLSYNDLFLDKLLISVALSDAKKNIQSHTLQYHLNYLISKNEHRSHALSLSTSAEKKVFQYQDNYPLSGYYQFVFIDTLKTNDSLGSLKIDIPLSYTYKYKKDIFQLSYHYQWNKIHLYQDSIFQNHFLEGIANTYFQFSPSFRAKNTYELKYIVFGTQQANYFANILLELQYKKLSSYLSFQSIRQSPTFQENFWYSNHFIWRNQFKDVLTRSFSTVLDYASFIKLSYRFFDIQNFIFFAYNYPQQYDSPLFIHQLQLSTEKVFFKHLGFILQYYYQWKNTNAIALPAHFLKSDLYYQGRWFHKNLLVNTGIQLVYTYDYFDTYQYNPATGTYNIMLQPFLSGQYPQLAVYFSGRIKPVNFFIRIDNLLSGIYAKPYYFLPYYMMPDRAFRMGISWMFFD